MDDGRGRIESPWLTHYPQAKAEPPHGPEGARAGRGEGAFLYLRRFVRTFFSGRTFRIPLFVRTRTFAPAETHLNALRGALRFFAMIASPVNG